MADYLLLAGIALCLLSVVLAIVQTMRTEAPRGAAIMLIAGIALIFGAAYVDPQPFGVDNVTRAWSNVTQGLAGPAT